MKLSRLALLALLAAGIAVANASVFVFYPITTTLSPVAPPIIFAPSSNTNTTDLGGNTIQVVIGDANASLEITVHPTYQTTYYKDIALIKNTDSNKYYFCIKVDDALVDPIIDSAELYIYNVSTTPPTLVTSVSLTATSTSCSLDFAIGGGIQYRVDLNITISESGGSPDSPPSLTDNSATIQLVYGLASGETAP